MTNGDGAKEIGNAERAKRPENTQFSAVSIA